MFHRAILLVCIFVPSVISLSLRNTTCGPVCEIYCQYGNVVDANGCPTCKCKPSPCSDGQQPLDGYFCGRGPNRQVCPEDYQCVIAPNDAYAVCCPDCQEATTKPPKTIVKPGSCPKTPSGTFGICIAQCTTDSDCKGKLKCCGSCPRTCVKPVRNRLTILPAVDSKNI